MRILLATMDLEVKEWTSQAIQKKKKSFLKMNSAKLLMLWKSAKRITRSVANFRDLAQVLSSSSSEYINNCIFTLRKKKWFQELRKAHAPKYTINKTHHEITNDLLIPVHAFGSALWSSSLFWNTIKGIQEI